MWLTVLAVSGSRAFLSKENCSMVVSDYYSVAGSCRIGETSAALAESLAVRCNRNENIKRVA